ncbi:MAG: hypothetical protein P8L83_07975 [Flavobacteriaceae bacterium]|nr:hypothetical protein [Flavobacteriaceae bacterium]
MGDFILPSHLGHLETCTELPSSRDIESFIKGSLQFAQLAFTAIPQTLHL